MSGGRVDVGFGRGIWPYEGPQFHPNADPRKDKENRELFRETVEIVREIWRNEYFSYNGSNYSFPAEDTVFSHPMYSPNPEVARWRESDETSCDAETISRAASPNLDDCIHRQLGYDGG